MKRNVIYLFLSVCALYIVSACVQDGYNLGDVNKEGAFSHENGISVQIGSFDTITFKIQAEVPEPIDIEYVKEVEELFSEEMYNYFVYDNKGIEEPLGDILFEADFIARIDDPAGKAFSDFELSTKILKENGDDTGINIEKQTYKTDIITPQPFVVKIKKEDVTKLKEAHILQLTFVFQARKVERSDYALIENISVKLAGGFKIGL
jgi:hypothetical protein